MDAERFDTLTRSLTRLRTRRGLLRLLGGLSLGGMVSAMGTTEALAAKRIGGALCTKGRQCKTGKCVGPAGQKTCSCSKKFPKCMQPTDGSYTICCEGACITGTPCPGNQFCGDSSDGCGGTINCGTCQGGETCDFTQVNSKECVCYYAACPLGTECSAFGNHEAVCQTGTNGLKCCCFPNGGTLTCTPGPSIICCSGFCGADSRCAAPSA